MRNIGFKRLTLEEVKEKQKTKAQNALGRKKKPKANLLGEDITDVIYPQKNKKKPRAKGERSSAKLKKDLDAFFSKYIRKIYPPFCYTCGSPSERLQCGHYISRQYLATRWSKDNCRPQCWGCNGYGKGQPLIFEEKLKAEYGNDFVEAMKASRHQTIKLDRNWYLAEIERYQKILSEL